MGAVFAAFCSLACAKATGVPHGARYFHASVNHAYHAAYGNVHRAGRSYVATPNAPSHPSVADRNVPPLRGAAGYATAPDLNSFAAYSPGMHAGMRRIAGVPGYDADMRSGMQYAGAITPVSAESRGGPRPPVNAPVRTGSIRADVARYNEERGAPRGMQRQSDDPRQPDGSPYRN